VLDVGCGTGLWCYIVGRRFPEARVVGVDIDASLLNVGAPQNFEFLNANILPGLAFEDRTFDYVHQRLMVAAIPLPISRFKDAVMELIRVTKPGGWVELLEAIPFEVEPGHMAHVVPEGPMTRELWGYFRKLGDVANLDSDGQAPRLLELWLREAGLVNVQSRTIAVPIGEWAPGAHDWRAQSGRLLASSYRSLFLNLIPRFARFGLCEERCRELIAGFLAEVAENQATTSCKIVLGQKPA
jgi:SAM-dependent methyltransferase